MFKPGDMILYHMPYESLPIEKRIHGPAARPFLVVQAWPNEYGPGKHGYNGQLFLDGQNDANRELNPEGRSAIHRYDRLPFAYGYSVPEGTEPGMVSAAPTPEEEAAALPPMVNVSGWGMAIPGERRGARVERVLKEGKPVDGWRTFEPTDTLIVTQQPEPR